MDKLTYPPSPAARGAPVAPPSENKLQQLATKLKADARAHPCTPITPITPALKHGASLMVRWDRVYFQLRVVRSGLSPLNEYNSRGEQRLKAWRREVATFRRDFGVPEGAFEGDGAQELIYFVDIFWQE